METKMPPAFVFWFDAVSTLLISSLAFSDVSQSMSETQGGNNENERKLFFIFSWFQYIAFDVMANKVQPQLEHTVINGFNF